MLITRINRDPATKFVMCLVYYEIYCKLYLNFFLNIKYRAHSFFCKGRLNWFLFFFLFFCRNSLLDHPKGSISFLFYRNSFLNTIRKVGLSWFSFLFCKNGFLDTIRKEKFWADFLIFLFFFVETASWTPSER